jgi:hypothetical protein
LSEGENTTPSRWLPARGGLEAARIKRPLLLIDADSERRANTHSRVANQQFRVIA